MRGTLRISGQWRRKQPKRRRANRKTGEPVASSSVGVSSTKVIELQSEARCRVSQSHRLRVAASDEGQKVQFPLVQVRAGRVHALPQEPQFDSSFLKSASQPFAGLASQFP